MADLRRSWLACDPVVKIVVPVLSILIAFGVLLLGEQRAFMQQIKAGDDATLAQIVRVEDRLAVEITAVERRTADRIGRVEAQLQWLTQEALRAR